MHGLNLSKSKTILIPYKMYGRETKNLKSYKTILSPIRGPNQSQQIFYAIIMINICLNYLEISVILLDIIRMLELTKYLNLLFDKYKIKIIGKIML